MKAADKIEVYNLDETWSKIVTVTSVEVGAHPENIAYLKHVNAKYEDWYFEDDWETIYLSDGTWIQCDLMNGVNTLMCRDEVDWKQLHNWHQRR